MQWKQMGIMEPEWWEAETQHGPICLHMDWHETYWMLCRWNERQQEYEMLFYTGTARIELAKKRAEVWLARAA